MGGEVSNGNKREKREIELEKKNFNCNSKREARQERENGEIIFYYLLLDGQFTSSDFWWEFIKFRTHLRHFW